VSADRPRHGRPPRDHREESQPHARSGAREPVVTIYTRPGCHLCVEALAQLERIRATTPFEIVERDISSDTALERAYLERIPVVALEGRELFEYFVDESALRDALAAVGRSRDCGAGSRG
jgi:glutaredoxin